jgi:hypothetical protein
MANSGAAAAMASLLPPHAVQLFIVKCLNILGGYKAFHGGGTDAFSLALSPRPLNSQNTESNRNQGQCDGRQPDEAKASRRCLD